MTTRNLAASVRARLLNHARDTKQDFNLVLTRFFLERMLYRISVSNYANQFLLKGALLFDLWFDVPHRPTRDADFLGFGPPDLITLKTTFKEICSIEVDDGVVFQSNTVKVTEIRKDANYAGIRITLKAILDGARSQIQADIGFGDAVTPGPEEVEYPTLLNDLPSPKIKAYPHYTVVAEKFEALSKLGISNSRMKDYFDLWTLACHCSFEGETLSKAIHTTFSRRNSNLSAQAPLGLTATFANDTQKQTQWQAFLSKNALTAQPLKEIVEFLAHFLIPVAAAASGKQPFNFYWERGGLWQPIKVER